MSLYSVVLIPGDGIGPEISDALRRVFTAAGAPIEWVVHQAGVSALEAGGELLADSVIDAIREIGVALKGPCGTPIGEGFRSINVQLRQKLNLYAAVRPVRTLPGVKTRYENVDLIVVRENTEGLYSGVENQVTDDVVVSMKVATKTGCRRIAPWAFAFAQKRKRSHVTMFHKANIMKLTDGLFLKLAREIQVSEFPDLRYDEAIIDAGCMRLVQDPTQFDVLLLENLYGDVVSDLCAGLVGGLGVAPGANFGDETAIFEAVHGSAPDIAGKGVANPLALLMSGVMLLQHLAEFKSDAQCGSVASAIETACLGALHQGEKTRDLGGNMNTEEFTNAVIARLNLTN